jgi:hypothetical protein
MINSTSLNEAHYGSLHSSLWLLIFTTNEPYVTLRPFGIFDLFMNRIVLVLYSLLI